MADFQPALTRLLAFEGVYDMDPDDPGGETVYGITRASEAEWPGWPRVDELKAAQKEFRKALAHDGVLAGLVEAYYLGRWKAWMLDQAAHQGLAECVFNACVNQGPRRSVAWLQYSVNALSPTAEDVAEDGAMGAATIRRANDLAAQGRGDLLLELLRAQRVAAYTQTVHNRENSIKFIAGWLSRIHQGG